MPAATPTIYASTSAGVFAYDRNAESFEPIFRGPGRSYGFSGISLHEPSGHILTTERRKSRLLSLFRELPGDARIYCIDPDTREGELVCPVLRLHDAHDFTSHGDYAILTDTGRNRLQVVDLAARQVVRTVNIGGERKDVHHVNAVKVWGEELLVGLNNRGRREAEILSIPLGEVLDGSGPVLDVDDRHGVRQLPGVYHTHDIVAYRERLIGCVSRAGLVIRLDTCEVLLQTDGWVRGLAPTDEGLWVGVSEVAPRTIRHSPDLDSKIVLYDHDTLEPLKTVVVKNTGQISSLLVR